MKRYIFSILFIIFLSITIFSCKKELLPEEEAVGYLYEAQSPRGSFATTLILDRPEKANGEVHHGGHVYYKGEFYYKQYHFDDLDKKTIDEFTKYIGKVIRVKGYITNGYMGSPYPYILNPKLIEVKDIERSEISQEDWTNPDSYIWK